MTLTIDPQQPAALGQLAFGIPTHSPPSTLLVETEAVRQRLDAGLIPDADMGGGSVCGAGKNARQ